MDFLYDYSVLILEESPTLQDLLSDWISGVTTKTVSSSNNIPHELDSTVIVACLSQTELTDDGSVKRYVLTHNPYCQIIGVLPRTSFVSPFEDQFDDTLQRPIYEDEFQQVIEDRLVAGAYSVLLSEFYDVNSSLVALHRASDGEVDGKQDSIKKSQARYHSLKKRLNSLQDHLSSDTIVDIFKTVEQHKQYLQEPDTNSGEGKETKFRPRRCPTCKLPWGVDHRNDLGNGYKKLGADVYQCARCDEIVHGLAGEQRVL